MWIHLCAAKPGPERPALGEYIKGTDTGIPMGTRPFSASCQEGIKWIQTLSFTECLARGNISVSPFPIRGGIFYIFFRSIFLKKKKKTTMRELHSLCGIYVWCFALEAFAIYSVMLFQCRELSFYLSLKSLLWLSLGISVWNLSYSSNSLKFVSLWFYSKCLIFHDLRRLS